MTSNGLSKTMLGTARAYSPLQWARRLCAVLVLSAGCTVSEQHSPVQITSIEYIEDSNRSLHLPRDLEGKTWREAPASLNFGLTSSRIFLRLNLENRSSEAQRMVLFVPFPTLDKIRMFNPTREGWTVATTGDTIPFAERPVQSRNPAFDVELEAGERRTVILSIEGEGSIAIPVEIREQGSMLQRPVEDWGLAAYLGMLVIMMVYNLFIFLSLRELSYLYYVLYAACLLFGSLVSYGFADVMFWPTSTPGNIQLILACAFLGITFVALFMRSFLHNAELVWCRRLLGLAAFSGVLFTGLIFAPIEHRNLSRLMSFTILLFAPLSIVVSIRYYVAGVRSARFVIAAFLLMACTMVILQLYNLGVLRETIFRYSWLIGSGIEVALLSIALADRINLLRIEKQTAADELRLMNQAYRESRVLLEDARLQALQQRMSPHFLFNALNTIHSTARRNSYQTEEAILTLADLYRYLTTISDRMLVPLRDEWEFLENYLKFARIRFQGTRSAMSLTGDASKIHVPPLLIQPVVENCFKHGFSGFDGAGSIEIRARIWKDGAGILVKDNGAGLPSEHAGPTLRNIKERLQLLYSHVHLQAGGRPGESGTRVCIVFFGYKDRN